MANSDFDYIVEDEPAPSHVRQLVAGLVTSMMGEPKQRIAVHSESLLVVATRYWEALTDTPIGDGFT